MSHLTLLTAAQSTTESMVGLIMPIALMVAVMYFLVIRPQKKREKQVQEMRSKLEVGDSVVTVGGIIGLVVSVRDDSLVIETGADRSKIRIARWAVQSNESSKTDTSSTTEPDTK